MATFDEYNSGGLDAGESDQDQIIHLLIFNKEFLSKCIRSGITPGLFVSDIRQRIVEFIFAYYEIYKEQPFDNVADILSANKTRITIREDDIEMALDFISRVIQIQITAGQQKRLLDKLMEFKKKQSIAQALSRMSKMKDQIDGTPEKLEEIMTNTVADLKRSDSLSKRESINDYEGYETGQPLTIFGIPEIDNAVKMCRENIIIIQAFTGRGKTWSITHLIKMATRLGNNCVAFITEMSNSRFKSRMRMSLTGWTGKQIRENMNEAAAQVNRSMVANADVAIAPEEWKMGNEIPVTSIQQYIEEIEEQTGKEYPLVFIDSPDDLDPPDGYYRSEQDKSKAIYTWLRNYAQNYNKCIIVTAQSQRAAEKLLWTTSGNIGDDINKVRRCTAGISINGYKTEVDADYTRLLVFKNTHGPEMKAAWIFSDFKRGQWIQEWGAIKNLDIKEYKERLAQRGVKLGNEVGIS